jgi:hypothetical protein
VIKRSSLRLSDGTERDQSKIMSVAAGDAHRVWFPEMVEHLRLRWRDDLSMEALLGLRDELEDMSAQR